MVPAFSKVDLRTLCLLPDMVFLGIAIIAVLLCFYFLRKWMHNVIKAQVMQDLPLSKVRSCSQGFVALQGHQEQGPDGLIIGKLSKKTCVWYRYTIEFFNNRSWQIIEQGYSTDLFTLNDGTGRVFIDPTGADISSPKVTSWQGRHRYPKGLPNGAFARWFGTFGPYRYREWRMDPQDPITVSGNFITLTKENIDASSKTSQVHSLLNKWSQKHQHLLNQFLYHNVHPTEHFSENTMRFEAQKELYRDSTSRMQPTFHVLSGYGLDQRTPFIISAYPYHKIMRRYRIDAFFWGLAFVCSFALTAGVIHFRLVC